jgi:hypothetical protein
MAGDRLNNRSNTTWSKGNAPTLCVSTSQLLSITRRLWNCREYTVIVEFRRVEGLLTRFCVSRTAKYGDRAPESADLLFEYGKALIENAIVQSAVLSKEEKEKEDDDDGAFTYASRNGAH